MSRVAVVGKINHFICKALIFLDLNTIDLLNWTKCSKCLRNECSVEIKIPITMRPLFASKKYQHSKSKAMNSSLLPTSAGRACMSLAKGRGRGGTIAKKVGLFLYLLHRVTNISGELCVLLLTEQAHSFSRREYFSTIHVWMLRTEHEEGLYGSNEGIFIVFMDRKHHFWQDYIKKTRDWRLWAGRLILLKCKIYANENSKTQFCIAVEKPKRMKRWDISCGAGCLYFNFHQKWSKLRTNIHLGLKCSPIEKNI